MKLAISNTQFLIRQMGLLVAVAYIKLPIHNTQGAA